MSSFGEHLNGVRAFTNEYRSLVDCHMVDFATKNLWEKCLSESLRKQLESVKSEDFRTESRINFRELITVSSELRDLISRAEGLFLKNSRLITKLNDDSDEFGLENFENDDKIDEKSMNFMSEKKRYEVGKLAKVVGRLALSSDENIVVDAGAGKGYLSTRISERYRVRVLAVDSSTMNRKSAIRRQEIIRKNNHRKKDSICYAVQHIDEKTDYTRLIKSHYPDCRAHENCVLTGLHTCGKLAESMIKSFLIESSIKSLCVVPCCYHLSEDTLTENFSLSKNARMLAQQSVERIASKKTEPHPPSLFYRALLQIILEDLGIPGMRIGRGAPDRDFPSYVKWALTKIGVDSKNIPTTERLTQLENVHNDHRWKFDVFQSIRVYLGSVVEAGIVLDRVIHLENSGRCSKVLLMQLFDPLISPRCYAIVAMKNDAGTIG